MTKITDVQVRSFPIKVSWGNKTIVANQLSCWPEYFEERISFNYPDMANCIVKITNDEGNYGLGQLGGGKRLTGYIVEKIFKPFIIGKDVSEIEKIWEVCYRATIPIGRKGAVIEALSGVDIALWDLFGKVLKTPVYKLLGGAVRDRIPVYATGNNIKLHLEMGFRDVKLAIPYGPSHGVFGMKENEKLVRETRELIGDEGNIMLDCYMSWDEEYTCKMANILSKYNIRWIEEPLRPEFYDGYRRLRERLNPMGIMVTGGEHEFTRWGVREIIENASMDIVQVDLWRTGGISEFKKITALASAYDTKVIPHGSGAPVFHAVINSMVSPFAECIVTPDEYQLFKGEPVQKDGFVTLDDTPGIGYDLSPMSEKAFETEEVW